MKIAPAATSSPAILARPATGAGADGFARLLATPKGAGGGLTAGAGRPEPNGAGSDAPARSGPARAFAFGALGLFAPGRTAAHAAPEDGALKPSQAALDPPADATPNVRDTGASAQGRGAACGAEPQTRAGGPAGPQRPRISHGPRSAASGLPPAFALGSPPDPDVPPPAATRAVPPTRPPAQCRPAAPARLSVSADEAGVSLVVGALMDRSDHDRARARLAEAAAAMGVRVSQIRINGEAGAPPALGGEAHGHRPR